MHSNAALRRENHRLRLALDEVMATLDAIDPRPVPADDPPTRPERVAVPHGPEDDLHAGTVIRRTDRTVIVRLDIGHVVACPPHAAIDV